MYSSVLLFLNIGSSEMVLIVFVALLLFGGEKLPEIARGLGKGIRDFKDASEGVKREINNQINSYEEKKQDEKLNEAAAIQSQLPAQTETTPGTFKPVEGTIPVSDTHYTPVSDVIAENHAEVHHEPSAAAETHVAATHTDTAAPETTSNTQIRI
jgi:sec-independent protein translocase protein TatA